MTAETSALSLHHVGYVVANIPAAAAGFVHALSASWNGLVFEDPNQSAKVTFLSTRDGDALIELVEPAGENSPVLRFLRERGGGMHHLCYEVEDLESQMALMKGRGSLIVRRPKPAVAFDGRRIGWMLTPEKLLVEFLERSHSGC
jgi:methylmalonyl-CoA/ethylmalonyl-CoA epimerase